LTFPGHYEIITEFEWKLITRREKPNRRYSMRKHLAFGVAVALVVFLAQPVFSQTDDELKTIREEIKSLKEEQETSRKQLQIIKRTLRARQAPTEFKEAVINIQGAPSKGDKNAKLALIEFSDYQ
jgi:septal ring factor EnvC (AmiA/AmiB activator)